jgi:hypothetical protein
MEAHPKTSSNEQQGNLAAFIAISCGSVDAAPTFLPSTAVRNVELIIFMGHFLHLPGLPKLASCIGHAKGLQENVAYLAKALFH